MFVKSVRYRPYHKLWKKLRRKVREKAKTILITLVKQTNKGFSSEAVTKIATRKSQNIITE